MKFFKILMLVLLLVFLIQCKKNELVTNGSEDKNLLITFSNITLGGVNLKETVGAYFSTSSGTIYKASELANAGSSIDLVFVGIFGLRFFESPDGDLANWGLDNVPKAKNTKVMNYPELNGINFTADMFDSMTDSTLLNNLSITHDDNAFPQTTPWIVLFQNSKGQKGVIKVDEIVTGPEGHVVFSLKMQKYAQ